MNIKQLVTKEVGLAIAGLLVGAIGYLAYAYAPVNLQDSHHLAVRVVSECKEANYRPLCYEKKVPALMDKGLSMEGAYKVTKAIQIFDPDYHYCHVLAHNISAKETAKDPSKWKDIIARAPSGICGNGGLHGAFQERFRTDALPNATIIELSRELEGTCDPRDSWNPTFLERSSCMHGLGHLTMYIMSANIQKSIALCDTLAKPKDGDFRQTCVDGVFMQIFQPLEPEDKALVEKIVPTAGERNAFCGKFENIARTSCVKESWPLVVDSVMTPKGFEDFCAPFSVNYDEYRYCASGLVYTVFGRLEYDAKKMMEFCAPLPESLKNICISRTASRFIETDWKNIPEALSVCQNAPTLSKDSCFSELIDFAENGFYKNSLEAQHLCGDMPKPWKDSCKYASGISL